MYHTSNEKVGEGDEGEGEKRDDWIDDFSSPQQQQEDDDKDSSVASFSDDEDSSSEDESDSSSSSSSSSSFKDNHQGPLTTILPYVNTSSTYHIRNRRRNHAMSTILTKNSFASSTPSSSSSSVLHNTKRKNIYKYNGTAVSPSSSSSSSSSNPPSILSYYKHAIQIMISKKSSVLLLLSLFLWIYVQYHIAYHAHKQQQEQLSPHELKMKHLQERYQQILKQKRNEQSAMEALGSAVSSLFHSRNTRSKRHYIKPSKDGMGYLPDPIPKGCSSLQWHEINYPTCNDVHDVDLKDIFHKKHGALIPMDLGEGDKSDIIYNKETLQKAASMGYLGSGMWRQVWKVQPRIMNEYAVLKMMKSEHPVDQRNFDRHRRDAIVMERMQNSLHVVSMYGYCGNTVLTEYSGVTLSDYIYSTEEYDDVGVVIPYDKHTLLGKIDMAMDLLKGLKDLHELKIVHADIQAKQFLLDPNDGLKVNDFNRCRFLPKNDKNGDSCSVKIPSAPGGNRSPEEYELSKIDEKIDIFSAGNVLYGILTGQKPWVDVPSDTVRRNVMYGTLPPFPVEYEIGSIEEAFSKLIYKAYEFNAKKRPSANELLHDFSLLRERAMKSSLTVSVTT